MAAVDESATTGASWLHRVPPRAKIAALALVLAAVVVSWNLFLVTGVALVLAAAVSSARLPARDVYGLAAYPGLFALVFAFAAAPDPLTGALFLAKAVTAALAAVTLVFTTPYPQVFATLQPALPGLVGDALLMTYRSLFILLEKFGYLLTAVRLRSGLTRRHPVRAARAATQALGGLLLYSLDLAQRDYDVMRLRGYERRLRVSPPAADAVARRNGTAAVVAAAVLAAAALAVRLWWRSANPWSWTATAAGALVLGLTLAATPRPDGSKGRRMASGSSGSPSPRNPSADEIVYVSCVRHSYEDGTQVHLCGLDVVAKRGSRVAVLGPNGSGKTTLLYHILGLLRADEGLVRVFGEDPARDWRAIRRKVGVVLQNVDEQILAPTVADDVAFSARQFGLPEDEVRERVARSLDALGISDLAERVPHNLSGGEKRKVALAGALVMDPELLVLDEPFEGLDTESRGALVGLLRSLARDRGVTVIMSTHDIDAVPELADYAYVLAEGGRVVLSGTPEEVFTHPEVLAASNIRPPLLAELFARLRADVPDGLGVGLTVEDAARELERWRSTGAEHDA